MAIMCPEDGSDVRKGTEILIFGAREMTEA